MTDTEPDDLITVTTAAEILWLSQPQTRRLVAHGKIPHVRKLGQTWVLSRADVIAYGLRVGRIEPLDTGTRAP